jgi:hypothetical protein
MANMWKEAAVAYFAVFPFAGNNNTKSRKISAKKVGKLAK